MRPSMSICTPLALPDLGIKLGVGKTAADDQERVALLHQVPTRLAAEKADVAGAERHIFGHDGLAEPAFGDAGAEDLGDLHHFVLRVQGARPRRASRPFLPSLRIFAAAARSVSCGIMYGTGQPTPVRA